MEAGHILTADVLDIIFDERNKDYGAYDLRKHYQQRLMKALTVVLLLVLLVCVTCVLFGSVKTNKDKLLLGPDVNLKALPPVEHKVVPPPPLPPKMSEPPKIKTLDFVKPLIAPDEDVPDDKPLAAQDDLDAVKIGNANIGGKPDDGLQAPVEDAKGVVSQPKKQDAGDGRFEPVEIESQYPGGLSAWGTFLNRHLVYPQEAADIAVQGTVLVQFVVDEEGNISNINALSGPGELRAAAIAVIQKSGKWIPALQNGRHVKSHKKQPITFKIME
ncbi:MAG: TonB family protein [Chitinophagaceae bacterium]